MKSVRPAAFTADVNQCFHICDRFAGLWNWKKRTDSVLRFDQAQNRSIPIPIDLGPESDEVFLILFGTGIRSRSSLNAVTLMIGDEAAEVLYSGPAAGFAGLDQVNVRLPRILAGKGEVSIVLTVDDRWANAVTVSVR